MGRRINERLHLLDGERLNLRSRWTLRQRVPAGRPGEESVFYGRSEDAGQQRHNLTHRVGRQILLEAPPEREDLRAGDRSERPRAECRQDAVS